MNDNFHEQLITKKQKGNPLVIRIIVVVFIILFLTQNYFLYISFKTL